MTRHLPKGYTLIELLVTLSIFAIVFTVGYASFRQFSLRQQIVSASKSVLSDLRLIQQKAATGEKPEGSTCTTLNGYAFVYVSTTSYELRADCSNNANVLVKAVTLPTGITFSVSTNRTLFKVLGQGTNLASSNTVTLTQTVGGNSATVVIGTGGDIQ